VLTTDFNYDLPQELIAQTPLEPRHSSRCFVLDRSRNTYAHINFWDIDKFLKPGDLLVMNETRVLRSRLFAHKLPGGGKVEILLIRKRSILEWEAVVGGSGMKPGRHFIIDGAPGGEVIEVLDGFNRLIKFEEQIEPYLEKIGHVPLPPYIHTSLENPERYQTVYAHKPGSAAAPTAGLHFTPELLDKLQSLGIRTAYVNLQVGLDTFAPVTETEANQHRIHTEWCSLGKDAASLINETKQAGGRIIAVGTTSVRTIESAASNSNNQSIYPFEGDTNLFILPGYKFKVVDAMFTNFHLPKSTLLMLVSAFVGRENILAAYQEAIRLRYRFFSFGDAMLIL
jgi:S-adenosylmethionine:tRNA ribosyltransferase-isomerase